MPIIADCHLHSSFSGDTQVPMEEMILEGIKQGLQIMCFTEHNDFDFPYAPDEPDDMFILSPDQYLYDLLRFREKYADKVKLLFGMELGLDPSFMRRNAILAKSYDFDFIIGSSHVANGKNPLRAGFFENRSEEEAYGEYFESILQNIKKFSNFDVYGHLDYVVRYGPNKDNNYSYEQYKDIFDKILEALIEKGKGIEINTGAARCGLKELHPCMGILKRYRELGGEIVTIGSDSHAPIYIAAHFDRAENMLKECGFKYYTVFEKRVPEFIKL